MQIVSSQVLDEFLQIWNQNRTPTLPKRPTRGILYQRAVRLNLLQLDHGSNCRASDQHEPQRIVQTVGNSPDQRTFQQRVLEYGETELYTIKVQSPLHRSHKEINVQNHVIA